MIINVEASAGVNNTEILKKTANELINKLTSKFGNLYSISKEENAASTDLEWSQEIKIRKGAKVGAAISLKWEATSVSVIKAEVDTDSKLGSIILYSVQIPFLIIGAYMGYNHIAPLDFLPGRKLAAGLGGVLALIPGGIVVYLLNKILLKDAKAENERLLEAIRNTIEAN